MSRTDAAIAHGPVDRAVAWLPGLGRRVAVGIHGGDAVAGSRARWHRQASLTTVVAAAARIVTAVARLLMIPLALHLLGVERYGLWLSVGSALAWVGLVGPGLGYGLVNAISEASARDDVALLRQHVSTAVLTIAAVGLVLLALAPVIGTSPAWPGLLGVTHRPDLASDASALTLVAAVLCALAFSFDIVGPLCAGLQEGYLASLASMAASVMTVAGVVALSLLGGSLVAFALVTIGPVILANAGLGAYVFWRRHPQLRPSWRMWRRDSARTLLAFGGWMLLTQLGDLAIFQSANILISSRFGPGEVPRYAVPAALFLNVTQLSYLVVQPYWPAVKEASIRSDWTFIRGTMARTLKLRVAMTAVAAVALVAGGPAFIGAWAGEQAVAGRTLLLAMGAYALLVTISGNYVILLLGLGLVRTKALLTLFVGAAHVAAFFLLTPSLGLCAIPVGGGIAVLVDALVASRVASRHMRHEMAACGQ